MEKIQVFFKNFYSNKKLFWPVVGGTAALLVIVGVVLALCLGGGMSGCTVNVQTQGGMALENIGVYIYAGEDLVGYEKTDAQGSAVFTQKIPKGSVAVLEGVAPGFVAADSYKIEGAVTNISLSMELLTQMGPITLGGMMFDFTVTDTDGAQYTLSELLKEKKAVALNLWYTNCQPCKLEFPALQQAYNNYQDSVALLALNPVAEDSEQAVKDFKAENLLTFPMAKVDAAWESQISGIAYPTTIIIDRYGMVSLIHTGSIDDAATFENVFAYFTAQDYVQKKVASINDLQQKVEPTGEGTKENPLEFTGVTSFELTVDAGKTVYCNLYRVAGMMLTVESETVKVLSGEEEFLPVDGKVTCLVNSPDPVTPALVAFTNTGAATETYQVTLEAVEGSMEKPFVLELRGFTAELKGGNTQGVFYTYTAQEDGQLVITVKKAPEDVSYDLALNNLTTSKYMTLGENGEKNTDGDMTLTVEAKKGDQLQLIVSVQPDETGAYSAATVELQAAFVAAEGGNAGGGSGSGGSGSGGSGSGGSSSGSSSGLVNPDAPIEIGGKLRFDAEIEAGTRVYYQIRGVSGTTLCIYDSDAYVIYNGKTYEPNSSGNVFVWVETDDTHSPVEVEIGNSGSSKKTFSVSFYYPEGSKENPYELKLDESFSTALKSGNAVGVFYTFKANEAGRLKITLEDADGIECEINIQNKDTSVTILRNLSDSPNGTYTYMDLKANEEVVVWIVAYPDSNFNYPAADIVAKATFG